MSRISRFKWLPRTLVAVTFALLFALATTISALASTTLLQLSSDPFTVGPGQHATEVEPDTLSAQRLPARHHHRHHPAGHLLGS